MEIKQFLIRKPYDCFSPKRVTSRTQTYTINKETKDFNHFAKYICKTTPAFQKIPFQLLPYLRDRHHIS